MGLEEPKKADNEKYQDVCRKNRENALKRSGRIPPQAEAADKDNEKDKDKEKDKEKDNE